MTKNLIKTNCYDVSNEMIIVGSCLSAMQPMAFKELENQSNNIYEVCLEEVHLNMVIIYSQYLCIAVFIAVKLN